MKLIVFAASMTSLNILELLIDHGLVHPSEIVGILDDDPGRLDHSYYGYRVLGCFADITSLCGALEISHFVIGIGSPRNLLVKRYVYEQCIKLGLQPVNAIHRHACISSLATIGQGNFILPFTTISCHVEIGSNCVIPPAVSIMEGTKVCDHVQIHGHSFIAGNCVIEENVYIGPGSTVTTGVHIGANSVIGAGSLVLKTIGPNSFAYGSPISQLKRNHLFREVQGWSH